jgi:hypothetical protein
MVFQSPDELVTFARSEIASVRQLEPEEVVVKEVCHSNAWTVISAQGVFRIGESIRLDPLKEAAFWAIGRECGAITPNLLKTGTFLGTPYMITDYIEGKPPANDQFPEAAGMILRRLHESAPADFAPRGNWPARRDARFSLAERGCERFCAGKEKIKEMIRMASAQFAVEKHCPNHGDFRRANMLVGANGSFGLIDWTDAHLGSREEDIGGCDSEFIEPLLLSYQGDAPVELSLARIAGHSYARILSLLELGVFPQESFFQAERSLDRLISKQAG